MSSLFKPYEGKRPYLFISYPHKESETVVETIRILHDKRYRLWYDEGIPAGSDWPANIAQHMQDCEAVICFISEHFLKSQNCFSEIRAAVQLKKPMLVVYLEDVLLPQQWKPLLEGRQSIPVLRTPQERAQAILDTAFVRRRYRHTWRERIPWQKMAFGISLLLFLGSSVVCYGLVSGKWSVQPLIEAPALHSAAAEEPQPVIVDMGAAQQYFAVQFPDAQQEKAIRGVLGKQDGDIQSEELAQVRELYFCGNMVLKQTKGVEFDAEGNCRVNGAKVLEGAVRDLQLIGKIAYLENLALICQPVSDVTQLQDLVLLRELSLAGTDVVSVEALGEMPSLEVLHLEHTQVTDLQPLQQLPRLKTVTVSRDMLPLTWTDEAAFEVVLTK